MPTSPPNEIEANGAIERAWNDEETKCQARSWMDYMSPSEMETFRVSVPGVAPRFPRLFRRRLEELGPGEPVDRSRLEEVCGSESAANHFLDQATTRGALVPVAWGKYRVAGEGTLDLVSRIENPPIQRFVAWALELPEIAEEDVTFVAPWLWRDTDLNVAEPMPLVPLDPDEDVVQGACPQWDAFHMDLEDERAWRLVVGDEEVATFATPGRLEVVLILRASLDPRWKQAADEIGDRASGGADGLGAELDRLDLKSAPRGSQTLRTGKGLPARRRLLVPPWYMDKVTQRAAAAGYQEGTA